MDQKKEKPEVVIPAGKALEEMLDFDDSEYKGETPSYIEEVKIRFE